MFDNRFRFRFPVRSLLKYYLWLFGMLVVLYLLSVAIPFMPAFGVAFFWAALSAVSMIGVSYQVVIRKAHRQFVLERDGRLSRLNNGRMLGFLLGFVLSAFGVASFMVGSVCWDAMEWLMVALGGGCLPALHYLFQRFILRDLKGLFRSAYSLLCASAVAGVLLCAVYCVIESRSPDASSSASLLQAFLSTPAYFAKSGSSLLHECGIWLRLADAWTSFGSSFLQEAFAESPVSLIVKLIVSLGAFLGAMSIFSIGMILDREKMASIFAPIPAIVSDGRERLYVQRRYLACFAVLPIALIGVFLYADAQVSAVVHGPAYSMAQQAVRAVASVSVYEVDGVCYDRQMIDEELLSGALSGQLDDAASARSGLVATVQDVYAGCDDNVDDFLNWYYGMSSASRSERAELKSSSAASSALSDNFKQIVVGDASAELDRAIGGYQGATAKAREYLNEVLAECRIDGIPDDDAWLCSTAAPPAELSQILDELSRLGEASGQDGADSSSTGLSFSGSSSDSLTDRLTAAFEATGDYSSMASKLVEVGKDADSMLHAFVSVDSDIDDKGSREKYRKDLVRLIEQDKADVLKRYALS